MDKDSIRKLRQSLGMTQEQFAKKLGVHKLTISRWERSTTRPSLLASRQLERLARNIRVTLDSNT